MSDKDFMMIGSWLHNLIFSSLSKKKPPTTANVVLKYLCVHHGVIFSVESISECIWRTLKATILLFSTNEDHFASLIVYLNS